MDRNKAYRLFHALLGELGIRAQKGNILAGYGVERTTELTDEQLSAIIRGLEEQKHQRNGDMLRRGRSRVLRLLTEMGVYYVVPGEPKTACWERVNRFVASARIAGKVLYDLTPEELQTLERKLRSMIDKGFVYKSDTVVSTTERSTSIPVVVVIGTGSSVVN